MRREIFWHATFAPLAGLLLGAASALAVPVVPLHLPWTAAYVLLGALAALVVIPLEPHGSLNLAPVVFLVVALISGPWEGVIVAATAPILAAIVSYVVSAPRQSSIEAISAGGGGHWRLNPPHFWRGWGVWGPLPEAVRDPSRFERWRRCLLPVGSRSGH